MTKTDPPRPRGRPPRSPRAVEDMRRHIAACALRLFQDEGYEAVSMRRLAKEAGCTAMTLYKYFDSKFDILRQLWSEVLDRLFAELQGAASNPDPAKRLHDLSQGYVTFWLDNREAYFMLFMSGGLTRADVQLYTADNQLSARFDPFRSSLSQCLAPGIDPDTLRLRADLLICALNGIAQGAITISGYPWAASNRLVGEAVAQALAPLRS